MSRLVPSVPACIEASRWSPELWVPVSLASEVQSVLPRPWLQLESAERQYLEGQEAVCFTHPLRSSIWRDAKEGRPDNPIEALYAELVDLVSR